MDVTLLLLRVLHIGSAIFWVGSAFAFFLFFQPSAHSLGPDGEGAFMANLTRVRRFPMVILGAGIVTVGAGLTLYLRNAGGLQLWISSPTGIGFTIGAIAAIISFALGPLAILPTLGKLDAIGGSLAADHRPPTPDELATIQALQGRLRTVGKVDLVSSRSRSCSWPRRGTSASSARRNSAKRIATTVVGSMRVSSWLSQQR